MSSLGLYFCVFGILSVIIILFILIKNQTPITAIRIFKLVGITLLLSFVPSLIICWGLRNVLPNTIEIMPNGKFETQYKFFYDPYTQNTLKAFSNYTVNKTDSDLYLIRINYAKNPNIKMPQSELIEIIKPHSIIENEFYINNILPKEIYNSRTMTRKRKHTKIRTRLEYEYAIINPQIFQKEFGENIIQ